MRWNWENINHRVKSQSESGWQNISVCWNKVCAWVKSKMRKRIPADELLSPKLMKKGDKLYACALQLRAALQNDDCKNIAITGMYGSGKSSVIRTAIKRIPKRKILSISFVNYQNSTEPKAEKEMLGAENKIFQHILYKVNESQTRKSSFRRLVPQSKGCVIALIIWFITVLFSIADFCHIQWGLLPSGWYDLYHQLVNENWQVLIRVAVQSLSFVNIVAYLAFLLYQGYYLFSNIHVRSIEAKNVKIEIGDIEKVNFDKLLGEILYYLRAGGYKVVVFEDLDRIKVSDDLFIKLREINILLNESSFHQRRNRVTHFIYAIRDDVYHGEMRTKCFDYVIPIVPIVDKNNIEEYLANMQSNNDNKVNSIDKRDLLRLGTYISGKRALNNIFNEYMMYRTIIDTKNSLSKTNILALIIYKNLFPHDFSLVYERKGCLYSLFANKKKFADAINQSNTKSKAQCEEGIENLKKELIKQRNVIVDYLIDKKLLTYLKVEDRMIPISEFSQNEALFQKIVHGDIRECVYQDEELITYDVKFDDILAATKELDFAETHAVSLEQLSQKQKEKLEIEKGIAQTEANTLREMLRHLSSDEGKKILGSICDEAIQNDSDFRMDETEKQSLKDRLYELVAADYINEQYSLFISVPYTGMLTEDEIAYLHAILRREKYHWRNQLPNVKNLVSRLNMDDFSDTAILNYDILNYLLELKEPTSEEEIYLNTFIKTSRKEPSFITGGEIRMLNYRMYIDKVFENWQECVSEIINISDAEQQNTMFRLFFMAAPEIAFSERDRKTLSAYYGIINSNIGAMDLDKLSALLNRNQIKFTQLQEPTEETQAIFTYVTENGHFTITIENLRIIYGKEFENAAFTQIYNGNNKILKYLHQDFNMLIQHIPDTSIHENPETIIKLINDKEVDFDVVVEYINKQDAHIDLKEVDETYIEALIIRTNLARPTWENVDMAYLHIKAENSKYLAQYVKRHVDELASMKCDTKNADAIENMLLLQTDEFTNEEYRLIADCFTKKIGQMDLEGMDIPEEHMCILIDKDMLLFDKDTFECIEEYYSSQILAVYVMSNFAAFIESEDIKLKDCNLLGTEILKSSMRLDEKKLYMEKHPFDKELSNTKEYAKLYCFYYEKIGDYANTAMDALIAAMTLYDYDDNAWRIKISIINQINRTLKYNQDIETRLLSSLGEPYNQLSQYGYHTPKLDNNPENTELLNYLKENHPFVSDIKPAIWNQWKITFKHKSDE